MRYEIEIAEKVIGRREVHIMILPCSGAGNDVPKVFTLNLIASVEVVIDISVFM